MDKLNVLIVMGGNGQEREVSLRSGQSVYQAIQDKHHTQLEDVLNGQQLISVLQHYQPDVVLNVIHGSFGEQGHVAAVCELMNIAYVGSGVMSSAICMDKINTKHLLLAHGCATLPFEVLDDSSDLDALATRLGFPLCIKPSQEGSSVGVYCVGNVTELREKWFELSASYDRVLVEPWIKGREMTVGFINEQVLPVVEIVPDGVFYDYQAKYHSQSTQYLVRTQDDEVDLDALQQRAILASKALGIQGWGRIDFLVTDNESWVLEANTVPGMTERSLLPMAAEANGIAYSDMILMLIQSSWAKRQALIA